MLTSSVAFFIIGDFLIYQLHNFSVFLSSQCRDFHLSDKLVPLSHHVKKMFISNDKAQFSTYYFCNILSKHNAYRDCSQMQCQMPGHLTRDTLTNWKGN